MRENRRGQEGWEGRQKRCRPDPREGERREAGWERPGRRAVPGSVGLRPGRGAARFELSNKGAKVGSARPKNLRI